LKISEELKDPIIKIKFFRKIRSSLQLIPKFQISIKLPMLLILPPIIASKRLYIYRKKKNIICWNADRI